MRTTQTTGRDPWRIPQDFASADKSFLVRKFTQLARPNSGSLSIFITSYTTGRDLGWRKPYAASTADARHLVGRFPRHHTNEQLASSGDSIPSVKHQDKILWSLIRSHSDEYFIKPRFALNTTVITVTSVSPRLFIVHNNIILLRIIIVQQFDLIVIYVTRRRLLFTNLPRCILLSHRTISTCTPRIRPATGTAITMTVSFPTAYRCMMRFYVWYRKVVGFSSSYTVVINYNNTSYCPEHGCVYYRPVSCVRWLQCPTDRDGFSALSFYIRLKF